MKTFRTIGLTLAAVLMCVNFTACEEDDDEPAQNKNKKLVEMKIVGNDEDYTATETFKFSYDENNRLVSCEHNEEYYDEDDEENYSFVLNYTWEGNTISEDYKSQDHHSHSLYKLENGLIKSISESVDVNGTTESSEIAELTYNSDNRIIEFNIDNKPEARYTWENNKITSYVEEDGTPYSISYNDKTCNGHFPLLAAWLDLDLSDLAYTNPELFGLKQNALPSKIERNTDKYKEIIEIDSYTFDSDGYVKSFTVNYYDSDSEENGTVTLKWE
ncbi:MAG: DUF4595 domain-containing protein [Paludibacteraceae bacterium]|nr:DUF4595 domain-containing protein [Paludibacteraceae bacterium]